ncbi:MAG TPA: AAA family ATPase [bacterium]|nr:AAA family ATPase [bacterium]
MRIKSLRIENFRSIESLTFEVPQICALIGPNNAGKSNILEALRRILGTNWVAASSFSPEDIFMRTEAAVTISCSVDPPISYHHFKEAPRTDVHGLSFEYTRYKMGEKKGQPRLEQSCRDERGKPPSVLTKAPKMGQTHQYERLIGIPPEVRDAVPLIYIGTNRSLKEQLPSARYSLLRQMFEDINRGLQDPKNTVRVKRGDGTEVMVSRIERFRELMESALELLHTDAFNEVESSIKDKVLQQLGFDPVNDASKIDLYFKPIDSLDFYKTLDLHVREDGFTVSAQEMGEGMQNAIVLAILQAFEETQRRGAILLIEEPEMFLHPQMQRALYKTLRRIGEKNQIIYTTHSPHFVAVPDYKEIVLVRKQTGRTGVTISRLPSDSARREKLIKELDPERNELFFATRLLIVEGDTEKLALPEYARDLGIDLDQAGATIIEAGGKRNLMEFAKIAISFGIPTGVVYDSDSSDFSSDKKGEETTYNTQLDALHQPVGTVRVWRLDTCYEDHLRKALGEQKYQELCQKFPNVGKPTRARLIAMEPGLAIPEPVPEILRWLGNRPKVPEQA